MNDEIGSHDHESTMQWLEAQHRIKWQAKTQAGRCALAGEFMVLNHNRSPLLTRYVEAFIASLK